MWFRELVAPDEIAFEAGVFLLRKTAAEAIKSGLPAQASPVAQPGSRPEQVATPEPGSTSAATPTPSGVATRTLHLAGTVPPEVWNRLGTKIIPKLRVGTDLKVVVEFLVTVKAESAAGLVSELRHVLQELGLAETVQIE